MEVRHWILGSECWAPKRQAAFDLEVDAGGQAWRREHLRQKGRGLRDHGLKGVDLVLERGDAVTLAAHQHVGGHAGRAARPARKISQLGSSGNAAQIPARVMPLTVRAALSQCSVCEAHGEKRFWKYCSHLPPSSCRQMVTISVRFLMCLLAPST